MTKVINLNILIPIILAGMALASVPSVSFFYFGVLIFCLKLFAVILIIDVIGKTSFRKPVGKLLTRMFLIGIISFVSMYVFVMLR